jgi:hypothetical protein
MVFKLTIVCVKKEEVAKFTTDGLKTYCEHVSGHGHYEYSNYVLHWHSLAIALLEASIATKYPEKYLNNIFVFTGACYSASLFRWMPLITPRDDCCPSEEEQKIFSDILKDILSKSDSKGNS